MSQPQSEMPRYQCHKQVRALKIRAVVSTIHGPTLDFTDRPDDALVVGEAWVARHRPEAGGYYVVYEDGYASFSPAAAFESGYTLIPADHRDRVRAEHAARSEELVRLRAFFETGIFAALGDEERKLLVRQAGCMGQLVQTLADRIALF